MVECTVFVESRKTCPADWDKTCPHSSIGWLWECGKPILAKPQPMTCLSHENLDRVPAQRLLIHIYPHVSSYILRYPQEMDLSSWLFSSMSLVIPQGLEGIRALCQAMSDFHMGEHMVLVICMNVTCAHRFMMQRFLWRLCMAKVHRLDRGPVSVKELLLSNQVHFDNKDVLASITEWNIYTCWLALHFGSRMSSHLASSLVKEAALNFLKFYHWPPGKLEQVGTCDISWCWPLIPCRCISRVWVSEARRKYMYICFQ